MLSELFIFVMSQVLMVLPCIDDSAVCTQLGLTQQNECISMPEVVPCRCVQSCLSVAECTPFGATNDTDCNCRLFAMNGEMDKNQEYFNFLCPTTFTYRVTSDVSCRDQPPDYIENALVEKSTLKVTYRYMDQVTYNCIQGYTYSGYRRPTLTCNFDGRWHWATNAGNDTCDVVSIIDDNVLEEIDEFEPRVKEAQGGAVLGFLGILIFVCLIGGILCLDLVSHKKHAALFKRNTRQFRRWIRRKKREHTHVQGLQTDDAPPKPINDVSVIVSECSCPNKDGVATTNNITMKNKLKSQNILKIKNDQQKTGQIKNITCDVSKSFVSVKHCNRSLISTKPSTKKTPNTQLRLTWRMKTTVI